MTHRRVNEDFFLHFKTVFLRLLEAKTFCLTGRFGFKRYCLIISFKKSKQIKKIVIYKRKMSHQGVGGFENSPQSVTYYLNGPYLKSVVVRCTFSLHLILQHFKPQQQQQHPHRKHVLQKKCLVKEFFIFQAFEKSTANSLKPVMVRKRCCRQNKTK